MYLYYFLHITLPAVLPMMAVYVAARLSLALVRGRHGLRTTLLHELGMLTFLFYILAVLSVTINYYRLVSGNFVPAVSYNLTPLNGIQAVAANGSASYAALNILGNILMFMPFGFLLPMLWCRFDRLWITVLTGAAASLTIEVTQFFTGRTADIDDLMLNTLGAMAGFVCWRLARRWFPGPAGSFRLTRRAGQFALAENTTEVMVPQVPQRNKKTNC